MFKKLLSEQNTFLQHFFQNVNIDILDEVLNLCLQARGLLIFTGVGKSKIIAQKISQTLISTGTRALFLSAADALHGDIGIINKEDIVFFLSKSGATQELLELAFYVKKKGAKIVTITSEKNTALSLEGDIEVYLPLERELCPFNLAPTISTTLQLLFGDALAVALMHHKKFTLQEYALNHPAGAIGKKISMYVQDVMLKEKDLPVAYGEETLLQALPEFSEKKCGCLLIIDKDKHLKGVFTDGDLRRALEKYGQKVLIQQLNILMTKNFVWISPGLLLWHAIEKMEKNPKKRIAVLPVLEDKKLVGLVHLHDIFQPSIR